MKKKFVVGVIVFIVGFCVGFFVRGIELPKKENKEENEFYAIKEQDIDNYVKKIDDLTLENWKDYIVVNVWEGESKNSFGDVISTSKCSYITVKDNIYFERDDVSLEIRFREGLFYSDELTIVSPYEFDAKFDSMSGLYPISDQDPDDKKYTTLFTIDDIIECTRAKGSLYSINVPDEYWNENGLLRVQKENGSIDIIADKESLISYLNK